MGHEAHLSRTTVNTMIRSPMGTNMAGPPFPTSRPPMQTRDVLGCCPMVRCDGRSTQRLFVLDEDPNMCGLQVNGDRLDVDTDRS